MEELTKKFMEKLEQKFPPTRTIRGTYKISFRKVGEYFGINPHHASLLIDGNLNVYVPVNKVLALLADNDSP